jgi:ABC-type transport system involved in multi-copper enzyme maturation permease subunit
VSLLPIVERELRVSSRRKSTYYVRCLAAMLGLVMSFFFLLMFMLAGSSHNAGNFMFSFLSWYTLLTTLLAGIFLASDSLSEERREGTLGLLFLTDLKGYDIVLGKFMAISLNAFYGLLAVFPVLAVTFLTGGVTAAVFWRTCLALLNLLFFSVAAGMLISSFCSSSYRAITGTIALLVMWLAVTALAQFIGLYFVSCLSPFESFLAASEVNYFRLAHQFWISLVTSHLTGWFFLGGAAWRLHSFADKVATTGHWQRVLTRNVLAGRNARRARLLEANPVLWLLDDSRRLRWVAWALSLVGVAVVMVIRGIRGPMGQLFLGYATWPIYFLLKIFVAIQACRFFVEARRNGALELLCCTPLTMKAIVQGQWMLLRRVFLWPFVVLLSVQFAAVLDSPGNLSAIGPGVVIPGPFAFYFFYTQYRFILNNLADFYAVGWFGMWLASSMRRPNMAAGLTILFVVILPTIAFCVPTIILDAIFILVGWTKLSEDFRLSETRFTAKSVAS